MEVVKTDIYKQLKRNNLIVWAVVICCGLISVFAIWTARQASVNADRFIYSISSNDKLLPLELIEAKEVQTIFKKSHVKLFLENFYAYDQWNYKDRIEKALWLIDSEDGKKLYEYYRQQGHYNSMIQSTSSQTIFDIQPVFDNQDNFKVQATIEINHSKQDQPKRYVLTARGKLDQVSQNYPLNPYGYLILDFKELTLKEIKDE
ncbi:hypothetical protein FVB32_05320 [Flagellimonas hymeniacidonis]|uniref:Conjugal transfer protein TraK n=1 Tax=Flagellimonas hymeniacidonis TaxID=2603628 RepID=A0A5C8V958_9FLAO|nr:hypothetical protein [Flagellimonas hymeniacidonis]TXN37709.1 hypothetical protein FVB32_05320 [Flagellimonas hymeniacidonis]